MQEKKHTICAWFIPENFPDKEAIITKASELCRKHKLAMCEIGLPHDLSGSVIRSSGRAGVMFESLAQNNFDSINKASIVLVNNTTHADLQNFTHTQVDFRPTIFGEIQGINLGPLLEGVEVELQNNPPKIQPQPDPSLLAYLYGLIAPFIPDLTFIWTSAAARPVVDTSPNIATNSGLDASQRRAQEKMDALER